MSVFFRREEQFLKNEKEAWSSDLMDSSRSTITMRRLFTNRRDQVMDVRLTMKSHDLSTSCKQEGASI